MQARKRTVLMGSVLAAALLLVAGGILMLGRTFTLYNELSLQRHDMQLHEMVSVADHYIASQLESYQTKLSYVLKRRGFAQAEETWATTGATSDVLSRMQENLVAQDSYIHAILAIREGRIQLSTDGMTDYRLMDETESAIQPCFSGDGTTYVAVIDQTSYATYAALIHAQQWFDHLAQMSEQEGNRLLLMGKQGKILLHRWQGKTQVTAVEELNASNGDLEAVRLMTRCRVYQTEITESYHLNYVGDDATHEMRMMVIPVELSHNGHFIVGLTSDYDQILIPMQHAAIQMIFYGGMVIAGVLLLAALLVMRWRRHSRELQELILRNEETKQLLERTQELAHHQRLETIGTLTASIAHEFNNLLTPIMGYAILTLEGLPPEADDLAENVTEIYEASCKAKNIISRLSDLSRKNSENTFRPLMLSELVARALEVAAPAQPPHVTTRVHRECSYCRIWGNEMQLSQLLLNLILNAFQAMEADGGVLTLMISADEDSVLLQVADTGVGIPPDVLPRIFDPFFTTKGPGRGTGLGLAIVHQVMESHEGSIQVESTPGEGTVFMLRFRRAETPQMEET